MAWWGEIADHNPALYKVIDAAKYSAHRSAMSYLIYMAVRILEMHRILKPTGTLCLHCDSAMSHYLKVVLDAVFGSDRYRNEIVWRRTRVRGAGSRKLRRVHDTILVYAKSAKSSFNRIKMPHDESYLKRNYRHSDRHGRYHSMSLVGGRFTGRQLGQAVARNTPESRNPLVVPRKLSQHTSPSRTAGPP